MYNDQEFRGTYQDWSWPLVPSRQRNCVSVVLHWQEHKQLLQLPAVQPPRGRKAVQVPVRIGHII